MALPTQEWRCVGRQSFNPVTVEAVLDALYTLGTKATYFDGSTRTPGSGSAGTWARFQNAGTTEAVYCTPAISPLNARFIWAGVDSGSPTPTMAFSDTFAAGDLLVGINKNSGAFNAWDNASPFTSGDFSGYCRNWGNNEGNGTVYLYECQESAYVVIKRSDNTGRHMIVGAYVDSGSLNGRDAETDGRLYGLYSSGRSSAVLNMNGGPSSTGAWLRHNTADGADHHFTFNPGLSTKRAILRAVEYATPNTTRSRLPSGLRLADSTRISLTRVSTPNYRQGIMRDMSLFGSGSTGQVMYASGKVIGHVIGEQFGGEDQAILLLRNA